MAELLNPNEITVEDLKALESIQRWNELIYSGAADGQGTQRQFVAAVLGRRPNA